MTRISYQLNQFDKRKYVCEYLLRRVLFAFVIVDTIVVSVIRSQIQCLNRWLPGVFLINVKQRVLIIALNTMSIFVACPYSKSRGI